MFKVGDEVIYTEKNGIFFTYGKTYTVLEVDNYNCITLNADDGKPWTVPSLYVILNNFVARTNLNISNSPTEKHKCNCNFRDLLMNGCKCGGI